MTTTSSIATAINQPMKTFYQVANDLLLLFIGAGGYAILSKYI